MNKVTENLILDIDDIRNLFGNLDSNIDFISKKFDVSIKNNEQGLSITGDERTSCTAAFAAPFDQRRRRAARGLCRSAGG